MYTRFFRSIIMILIVMITTSMVVSAKPPTPPSPEDIELPVGVKEKIKTKAQLSNEETGEIIFLTPKLVRYQRDLTGLTTISYEVGIPSDSFEESQYWCQHNEIVAPIRCTRSVQKLQWM